MSHFTPLRQLPLTGPLAVLPKIEVAAPSDAEISFVLGGSSRTSGRYLSIQSLCARIGSMRSIM